MVRNILTATLLSAAASVSGEVVAAGYFAGYHIDNGFPVSSIPWDKYSEVKYAFAETTANGSLDLSESFPEEIPNFVAKAHENGVKASVSVGGWAGSRYFSSAFGSAENRTAFAKVCMDLVNQYGLDGIDFDVEYPFRQGLGCNVINENDTANFLTFLQEFRQLEGAANLSISAAASLFPWNDATGAQSKDVSGFAKVLDYIVLMNYDLYGMWSSRAGPNAPLENACDSRNDQGSAKAGVDAWIAAGMPAERITLGLAAYGHGFRVNETSAFPQGRTGALDTMPPFNSSDRFRGSSWDSDPPIDECGNASPPTGTYTYWSLITEAGFLDDAGSPLPGISTNFDNCSQTPVAWNATNNVFVSYDNPQSLTAKGKYITDTGLKGFAMWEIGGDYNNILINAARAATGLP